MMKLVVAFTCFMLIWGHEANSLSRLRHSSKTRSNSQLLSVRMPDVVPKMDDDYWCTYHDLDSVANAAYITQFEAAANGSIAHHIILFGCSDLSDDMIEARAWRCLEGNICTGQESILFAWAKNADPTRLPPQVGFDVGRGVDKRYLVMQVHYAHKGNEHTKDSSGLNLAVTASPPKYSAGIYIMLAGDDIIPPETPVHHVDINCRYEQNSPMHIFASRVHAHSLGVVIAGYRFSNDLKTVTEIAKGNPNWPQAFYPEKEVITIQPLDFLAARCTYNSTGRQRSTEIGSTAADEMCNLYLMYYAERNTLPSYLQCYGQNIAGLVDIVPKDSDKPLPRNPLLEEMAHSGHHDDSKHGKTHHTGKTHEGSVNGEHTEDYLSLDVSGFEFVKNWPETDLRIGQPTSVFLTTDGTLMIFHRGDREWGPFDFRPDNIYQRKKDGPIPIDTVVEMVPESGKITRTWGKNLFYLPHGITVDNLSNTWLTDVATHQVFKFTQNDLKTPSLVLGEAFKPGSDEKHFCKPTSVAISHQDGSIFIADGYCNSRIVKFDSQGNFVAQWGTSSNMAQVLSTERNPGTWLIPHSILLIEDRKIACAADRENARVQCLDVVTGDIKSLFYLPNKNAGAYAIAYTPENDGRLWVATAYPSAQQTWNGGVTVFDMHTMNPIGQFGTKDLNRPHDLAVDPKSGNLYVADLIKPYTIKRFYNGNYSYTKKDEVIGPKEEPLTIGNLPNSIKQLLNSSVLDTFTPVLIASLLAAPVLAILSVTLCIKLRRKKYSPEPPAVWWRNKRNRTGFKRVRQDDTLPLDSEEETTDSEDDDVLYTAIANSKKNAKC
ncbi:peptidyl-glycine alpha-amidating monooxygenase-like [Artemia franciscana]|uniref:Peptidylglycine monooxygenase n=1 Tax=Artemia franciscana TaxID=6661 RepID=A0AA88HWF7_ARTSF|nr:hypothetical protein QYM36_005622 [Artemia franciscana]KAK2718373.1 hypothetical protein QYM36_005622 [Artemia franciscana]